MAKKVSLTVIWASFETHWPPYKISNGIIVVKRPDIALIIATRGSECEVMAWESFPAVEFDL